MGALGGSESPRSLAPSTLTTFIRAPSPPSSTPSPSPPPAAPAASAWSPPAPGPPATSRSSHALQLFLATAFHWRREWRARGREGMHMNTLSDVSVQGWHPSLGVMIGVAPPGNLAREDLSSAGSVNGPVAGPFISTYAVAASQARPFLSFVESERMGQIKRTLTFQQDCADGWCLPTRKAQTNTRERERAVARRRTKNGGALRSVHRVRPGHTFSLNRPPCPPTREKLKYDETI